MSEDSQYISALERWNDAPLGPYGDGVGSPSLPQYRPSVLRDLRAGLSDLASHLFLKGWPSRAEALVSIWLGMLALGAFQYAYWAQWEKLAWYWTRTDAQEQLRLTGTARPPSFHRVVAYIVGLFWGLIGLLVTAVLWVTVAGITQLV